MIRVVVLATIALAVGCRPDDPVRRYRAPKDPTWRLVGAIIPQPHQIWSFKMTGPAPRIAPHKEEFLQLIQSIRFEEEQPRWTLPSGWTQEEGTGMRLATLKFGSEKPPLELSVIGLPQDGGGLLKNVNRWRGQVGLDPIVPVMIGESTESVMAGDVESTVVDVTGPKRPTTAPIRPMRGSASPPQAAGPPSIEELRHYFQFDLPSGWAEVGRPGGSRIFVISAAGAEVSFSYLGGDAGGLAANVNRWRGQVGLPPLDDGAAQAQAGPGRLLHREAWRVDLEGAEESIVCLFTLGGPFSLFLKLKGPAAAVDAQKDSFEAFAGSIRVVEHQPHE